MPIARITGKQYVFDQWVPLGHGKGVLVLWKSNDDDRVPTNTLPDGSLCRHCRNRLDRENFAIALLGANEVFHNAAKEERGYHFDPICYATLPSPQSLAQKAKYYDIETSTFKNIPLIRRQGKK